MSRNGRLATAVILGILVIVAGATSAAAYAWHRAGMVRLAVQESGPDGTNFSVNIPEAILDAAIAICPLPRSLQGGVDDVRLADLAPVFGTLATELERMPDTMLLDVRDGRERVRISKEGTVLRIRVSAPLERVDIDLPVSVLRRVLERLHAAALPAAV